MPGLMARILSRRADGAPPSADAPAADQPTVVVPAAAAGEEVSAEEAAGAAPAGEAPPADVAIEEGVAEVAGPGVVAAADEQPTIVAPAVEGTEDAPPADPLAAEAAAVEADPSLPAGAEPAPEAAPSFRNRGRLRRRLRYLRRVREIAFRDLGGLVFDLDRFGRERPDLVQLKLEGLTAIDAELRALEVALDDIRAVEELQEPGIAACAHCGALHGSEARFCPSCGTAVDAPPAAAELPAAAPAETPAAADTATAAEIDATLAGEPAPDADQPTTDQPQA